MGRMSHLRRLFILAGILFILLGVAPALVFAQRRRTRRTTVRSGASPSIRIIPALRFLVGRPSRWT